MPFSYIFGLKGKTGWGSGSHAEDIADKYADNIRGKVVVVTGCNTGIGKETVRVLAKNGAKVYMACRNMEKCQKAAEDIKNEFSAAQVIPMELNLSSLESVRSFVKAFLKDESKLSILINNAGVMGCPHSLTKDGFEMQFGTNHLGHFLLTELLIPTLKENQPSRIVNLASEAHKLMYTDGMHLDDLTGEKYYSKVGAYGQSKMANILYTNELNERLKKEEHQIAVNSVHPGVINTDLGRHSTIVGIFYALGRPFCKNIPQGAATTVYLASSPDAASVGGAYWADCNQISTSKKHITEDRELWKKLYEVSAKATKLEK